ncbi:hypothetical protein [Chryseobacterium paridis]|uniref:Lipoprotein n=1 Tax=Chryseobacterium paridis TaxID=2800328 RepID=A0ABS1FY90_9FLAO|nr:hypothetical protein [Chryseobacterium paridis]MBK1897421.1 hypothetical protein [Chryseobacterium paridis]
MKISKTIITMLILVFSLSPCSVKRDLLGIFDIQYISTLNKVKITSGQTFSCESSTENSSRRIIVSKEFSKSGDDLSIQMNSVPLFPKKNTLLFNSYSKTTSGNSPPKYILFKQLKLSMI